MRRGNNYSGARWAFSDRTRSVAPSAPPDGLSIEGSSRQRRGRACAPCADESGDCIAPDTCPCPCDKEQHTEGEGE